MEDIKDNDMLNSDKQYTVSEQSSASVLWVDTEKLKKELGLWTAQLEECLGGLHNDMQLFSYLCAFGNFLKDLPEEIEKDQIQDGMGKVFNSIDKLSPKAIQILASLLANQECQSNQIALAVEAILAHYNTTAEAVFKKANEAILDAAEKMNDLSLYQEALSLFKNDENKVKEQLQNFRSTDDDINRCKMHIDILKESPLSSQQKYMQMMGVLSLPILTRNHTLQQAEKTEEQKKAFELLNFVVTVQKNLVKKLIILQTENEKRADLKAKLAEVRAEANVLKADGTEPALKKAVALDTYADDVQKASQKYFSDPSENAKVDTFQREYKEATDKLNLPSLGEDSGNKLSILVRNVGRAVRAICAGQGLTKAWTSFWGTKTTIEEKVEKLQTTAQTLTKPQIF
jgi:hypothetical protein